MVGNRFGAGAPPAGRRSFSLFPAQLFGRGRDLPLHATALVQVAVPSQSRAGQDFGVKFKLTLGRCITGGSDAEPAAPGPVPGVWGQNAERRRDRPSFRSEQDPGKLLLGASFFIPVKWGDQRCWLGCSKDWVKQAPGLARLGPGGWGSSPFARILGVL